jgi:hypothetical protein
VIVATLRSFEHVVGFKAVQERAEQRKGGAAALARLLPPRPDPRVIADLPDDRILADMTKRVFFRRVSPGA